MTIAASHRRREIANLILGLPAARALTELDPGARAALAEVLADLGAEAASRAQRSWSQNKGIMAAYWKAVSVYARHIRRVLMMAGGEARGVRVGRQGVAAPSHRNAPARLPTTSAVPGGANGAYHAQHATLLGVAKAGETGHG